MSNVSSIVLTFFDLYSRGDVSADRVNDFIAAWHASDDNEQRTLAAYLGRPTKNMTSGSWTPMRCRKFFPPGEPGAG